MSLFLGRIHYIMYEKIIFQEEILESLLKFLDKDESAKLKKDLDREFPIERGKLEDIIDTSNIHAWLDKRVVRSENRLAKAVSILLKNFDLEKIKNKFFEIGKNYNGGKTPLEAFNFITSKFLDGMPCDHALAILKNDKDELVFTVEKDVHESIWKNYVDPKNYWILRDNFIEGSLKSSNIKFEKIDENYILRK
ncbi:hypothetical protein HKO22_00830 [Peptoniphilus sp. AGMB00490]|uniref:Uncharacterized protein n=1 Tax=Peptoniphilus faecalis TaxID=2731255 RepID=A0A848RG76_9FIRM|nr:hypothetical protein [Peptoniphilus faecalis]NMW84286.1 hypothetical protein [Peptoniphilus faecalis]